LAGIAVLNEDSENAEAGALHPETYRAVSMDQTCDL
jgi:hypothetical protein